MPSLNLKVAFILASQSPRRRAILRQIGIPFTAIPADVDESESESESTQPNEIVRELALRKAAVVAAMWPSALVLGADTIVSAGGILLGKPNTLREAKNMLRMLSGRTHTVYTGIALIHGDSRRRVTAEEATRVTFADLTDQEISEYVATGIPMDKAGAYGIQDDYGCVFVKGIEGDYFTVVGLPAHRLYQLISMHFTDLVRAVHAIGG